MLFNIGHMILQSYGHMVNISMLSKSWKQKSTYMYYTWISTLQSMFLFAVWSSDISLITSSLGTIRSVRPLAVGEEEKLLSLLGKMQKFYQYHGINLRTCYEDFDRHHMGVVTESQVKIILQLHVSVMVWNFETQNQYNNNTSSYFFPLKHMGTCKTRLVTVWFVVHAIPENVDIINCQRKTISNFSVSQTIPWPPRCKW